MITSPFATITRRRALTLGLMASAYAAGGGIAAAETYPSRSVRIVLPFAPGGGTDTLTRILSKKMSEDLGQAVIVDNRPGAAGNLATTVVAKATNDGYMLLLDLNTVLTVNPSLYPDMTVDIAKELAPISMIAEAAYVLVINPKLPVNSLKDLIDYAKAHPGALNYASAGVGSPLHLAGALLGARTGIDIIHVAYKGGGPAVLAVLAGDAQFYFGSIASTLPHIQAGKLKSVAVTSLKRSALLPNVPTMDESGLPGFNVTSWYGLLAPAGVSEDIVTTWQKELRKALVYPEVRAAMDREGLTPMLGTAAEMAEKIKTETASWKKVIEDAHIKPQ
jgi:tripartite-type tricarboxylate transporter receptor subunit TctC